MTDMYKKLKKLKGERFAQAIRNFHNGILEIPNLDEILRFAGRDPEPLFKYLLGLMAANDDNQPAAVANPVNPFELLGQAGYDAFYADTLKKQNSIRDYYAPGELLCTFNDSTRHEKYHIVHAVRKDVKKIRRQDFKGREEREDTYGRSVISIQMAKDGGFISIKNRYNHAVQSPDKTFGNNPDNICQGLTASLQAHFNVKFAVADKSFPEGYTLCGEQIFKYNDEYSNIYYGDQAWAVDGVVREVSRTVGDALFDRMVFDNETKSLIAVDPNDINPFPREFNRIYGGNKALHVKKGNLYLGDTILIGAENSQITSLYLPRFHRLEGVFMHHALALREVVAPNAKFMDGHALRNVPSLKRFEAPLLRSMTNECFFYADSLEEVVTPSLKRMGEKCFWQTASLKDLDFPALEKLGHYCFYNSPALQDVSAPLLAKSEIGDKCFLKSRHLRLSSSMRGWEKICYSVSRRLRLMPS